MRWLENPRDEAERKLRVGLDLAAGRTDELALRRVWGRLVDLPPLAARGVALGVPAGRAWSWPAGLAAAIGFVWPLLRRRRCR